MDGQQSSAVVAGTKIPKQLHSKYKRLFIMYCFFFFGYGAIVNALGPLFPHLASDEHKQQTEYSTLFIFRAIGYLAGCVVSKTVQQRFPNHFYLSISSFLLCISSMLFTIVPSSMVFKCILMVASGWGCAKMNMFLHACIIYMYKSAHLDWYLIVAHGAFGVGGLLGPLLVYFVVYWSYAILSAFMLVGIFVFSIFVSPEKLVSDHGLHQPLHVQHKQHKQQEIAQAKGKSLQLWTITAIIMCPIFMIIVGQETIYGGWISSYAVMKEYSDKQHAAIFSSVFWIAITGFRFILAYVPGRPTVKILLLFGIGVVGAFVSLLVIHFAHTFGLFMSAVLFGLSTSVLYALAIALPQDYGLVLTPKQSSNFILSSAFGEGILAVLVGRLMQWFGADAMFYFLGLSSIVAIAIVVVTIHRIKNQVSSAHVTTSVLHKNDQYQQQQQDGQQQNKQEMITDKQSTTAKQITKQSETPTKNRIH